MRITDKTRLNLVIGYPLTHSQSPLLHQVVYKELSIDHVLLAQSQLSLKTLIQMIKSLSIELTAVTSPYKEHIIPYLDGYSSEVGAVKAANTIIQRNGKLYGYNTDIDGIAFAFRNINVKNKKVLIIGAGGAAKALGYFFKKNNAIIFWLNRSKEKAKALAKEFGHDVILYERTIKQSFDIFINATTIGLYPNIDESPLSDMIFHSEQIVADMIYNPFRTKFLKKAEKEKAKIVSGLDIFIAQGLKQIELFSNKQYPLNRINFLRKLLLCNQ